MRSAGERILCGGVQLRLLDDDNIPSGIWGFGFAQVRRLYNAFQLCRRWERTACAVCAKAQRQCVCGSQKCSFCEQLLLAFSKLYYSGTKCSPPPCCLRLQQLIQSIIWLETSSDDFAHDATERPMITLINVTVLGRIVRLQSGAGVCGLRLWIVRS